MPLFRKRPITISAEQFFAAKKPWPDGVHIEYSRPSGYCTTFVVDSLEGPHTVRDGYWIITGVAGEKYGCAPDIFEKTYEPVDD